MTIKKFENFINEISSDTFKSAINVSKERDTTMRTWKLGKLFFNEFVGKELLGYTIQEIGTNNPKSGNYRQVSIILNKKDANPNILDRKDKQENIYYDIDKDIYTVDDVEMDRKDAVLLAKIAKKINPDTKYKETGKYFKIKGHR